jgi:threonine dehydrogenase-like Zn-dependent dehydrogenase
MKGVVFLGDRKLELRRFPDPTPGPRDVILEIKASGMCGSDLHTYRAPANPGGVVTGGIKRAAGVIAGHEPCGVVAAVGTAVSDREARIGQRVMDHHYDGCGADRLRDFACAALGRFWTKRTYRVQFATSAFGGKADIGWVTGNVRF